MPSPLPEDHQPPLGAWGHAWRLLLCVLISAVVWASLEPRWESHRALWWTDVLLGAASFVLVLFRRRWPVTVGLVTQVLMVGSATAAGPATLAAVSVATRLRLLQTLLVSVAVVGAGMAFYRVQPQAGEPPPVWWFDLAANVVITIGMMGWGMYIGSRRQVLRSLTERAVRAETEQGLRAAQAQAAERNRIAREMHDVLAHRISQISMQAGALSYRTDLDADTLREGTAEIQTKANQALTDLRGVLGVLRDADGTPLDRPVPTYDDLPDLVADAREEGMHLVYLDLVDAAPGTVPDATGRTLYRIVQEGITNARKHAPGAALTVSVAGGPEEGLSVRLRNPIGFGAHDRSADVPAALGAGLGLIGLTERAELRGGRLRHRREGDAFVVEGWVPWGG